MSAAMHLRDVKNKAERKAHTDRVRQRLHGRIQAKIREGQIAAMARNLAEGPASLGSFRYFDAPADMAATPFDRSYFEQAYFEWLDPREYAP